MQDDSHAVTITLELTTLVQTNSWLPNELTMKFSFSSSIQLSMKILMLINVKMPTYVGILTFICRINTKSEF